MPDGDDGMSRHIKDRDRQQAWKQLVKMQRTGSIYVFSAVVLFWKKALPERALNESYSGPKFVMRPERLL